MKRRIFAIIFTFLLLNCTNYAFGKNFFANKNKKQTPTPAIQKAYTIDEYIKDMENQIKAHWTPPQNSFKNKTVVNFQILRDGTIKNADISKTSGDKEFDKGAMLALANTGKVAPLPKNFLGESIDISFTFERFSYLIYKDRYDR